MEPSSKRRRLAPKAPPETSAQQQAVPAPPAAPSSAPAEQPQSHQPAFDAVAPMPERHDFESFARHLQDAAMLIYRQTQRSPYSSVSVLLLRWEEDVSVEQELLALEAVFRDRYNYRTERWHIPTVPNPSIKLGVQMASFLENARPEHLLVVYYAGHGYAGSDNQLYWASNSREDAAKLKWNGVRCLFEDAQSDILLLLDSCAVKDTSTAGSHGMKQAIAAYGPEQSSRDAAAPSFTATLVEALQRLNTGRPFSAQRLYDEVLSSQQQSSTQAVADGSQVALTNGTNKITPSTSPRSPLFFTLTPGKCQSLSLAPLPAKVTQLRSPPHSTETDGQDSGFSREDQLVSPGTVVDLTFDEARVLVCTTFVGDASPEMTFFNQWLHDTPPVASKITVEGMFLGPPTMLLISMPHSIWNVVQHDKVCCFLGYISSHNMIHLYKQLVGTASVGNPMLKGNEDHRVILQSRDAATSSSSAAARGETSSHHPLITPDTPSRQEHYPRDALSSSAARLSHASPPVSAGAASKDDVEDSAEMQEAAEQLKALSHVRHSSSTSGLDKHSTQVLDTIQARRGDESASSPEVNESITEGIREDLTYIIQDPKPKPRKSLQKQAPKQETRCTFCSHAPFKDSSSLRKHIAAAHTRPFPCAFSFAGCTSTFGSKNEWKRHIASQHLCLTYYRCSSCPASAVERKVNEFNRKDLFTQHLRRMHAPFAIKKAIAKGDSKLQADWESHVKEMQQSCLVIRRHPPERSACPKPDCQTVFEGHGSWDEWTEHVGRHMEKGEAERLGVDRLLAKWALDEGIIERKEDGEYRLCSGPGSGGERESHQNGSFVDDGGKREDDDEDPSITVAMPISLTERMDVDD